MQLPEDIQRQIELQLEQGDQFIENEQPKQALECYWQAWELLPEPPISYEAAAWILVAIGDTCFMLEDFKAGRDNLTSAMLCPGTVGNPFAHFRLGQCLFELGETDAAQQELHMAYQLAGEEIFEDEPEKYLQFAQKKP